MASLRTSTAKGFTLIELLVIIGMLAIIGTFTLLVSFDSYRQYSFRNDRDLVIASLQRARNQAINNICLGVGCTEGKSHGVHIEDGQVVIFQTETDYAGRDLFADEIIPLGGSATSLSGVDEVVFERLSGKASVAPSGAVLIIADATGRTSEVEFNAQGLIKWTN